MNARELRIGQDSVVRVALAASDDGGDFADAVIAELGREAGCRHTVTFDRRAAELAHMRLLTTRALVGPSPPGVSRNLPGTGN